VPQGALGIGEAEEPHGTFVENALAKARHAARAAGGAAIADDSGLCVQALGGAARRRLGALRGVGGAAARPRGDAPRAGRGQQRTAAARAAGHEPTAARASSARWWRCARTTTPSR
jgi:XTP/dITP diphosphohydrolase